MYAPKRSGDKKQEKQFARYIIAKVQVESIEPQQNDGSQRQQPILLPLPEQQIENRQRTYKENGFRDFERLIVHPETFQRYRQKKGTSPRIKHRRIALVGRHIYHLLHVMQHFFRISLPHAQGLTEIKRKISIEHTSRRNEAGRAVHKGHGHRHKQQALNRSLSG